MKGFVMLNMSVLKKLIHQHRLRLGITYALFSLEMTGSLLRPFFLGMAINDLMQWCILPGWL
jgi:hypothetical protein